MKTNYFRTNGRAEPVKKRLESKRSKDVFGRRPAKSYLFPLGKMIKKSTHKIERRIAREYVANEIVLYFLSY